ncbi:MAG: hypothetical protein WDA27_10105 [Actinomycetota bacterium]
MKRVLWATLLAAAVAAGLPGLPAASAHPGEHPITFPVAQAIPCGPGMGGDICAYNPPASELGYKACENPFPPGSWVDIVTEQAPTPPPGKKVILILQTSPQIDWDTFICGMLSNGSHNGGELARGANALAEPCDNLLGPESLAPIGCQERAQAPVSPGGRYVLRAYNYSDVADLLGHYTWVFV